MERDMIVTLLAYEYEAVKDILDRITKGEVDGDGHCFFPAVADKHVATIIPNGLIKFDILAIAHAHSELQLFKPLIPSINFNLL